jgi:hypothetical protein
MYFIFFFSIVSLLKTCYTKCKLLYILNLINRAKQQKNNTHHLHQKLRDPKRYYNFLGLRMSSTLAPASIASNLSTYHQGKTLSPLAWSDDKILETVYITHVHTGERYDVESLFNLTSNILRRSTAIADSVSSKVYIIFLTTNY